MSTLISAVVLPSLCGASSAMLITCSPDGRRADRGARPPGLDTRAASCTDARSDGTVDREQCVLLEALATKSPTTGRVALTSASLASPKETDGRLFMVVPDHPAFEVVRMLDSVFGLVHWYRMSSLPRPWYTGTQTGTQKG